MGPKLGNMLIASSWAFVIPAKAGTMGPKLPGSDFFIKTPADYNWNFIPCQVFIPQLVLQRLVLPLHRLRRVHLLG